MFLHKMLINPIKRFRLVLEGDHVLNREKINLDTKYSACLLASVVCVVDW